MSKNRLSVKNKHTEKKKIQINETETVLGFSEGQQQSGQRPGEEHRSLRWNSSASTWMSLMEAPTSQPALVPF